MKTTASTPELPHSVELEQQILGAVLLDNERFHKVAGIVRDEHFFDPVHGIIWGCIRTRIGKDLVASPVTIKADLESNPGLKDLGGPRYLVRLAKSSISAFALEDYSKELVELHARREIVQACDHVKKEVSGGGTAEDAASQLEIMLQRREEGALEPRSMSLLKAHRITLEQMVEARKTGVFGISTGLKTLDKLIGGLRKKDLILIPGATSMGKTTLGTWLAIAAAKQGYGVGFVSREMSEESLSLRIASIDCGVPYEEMMSPDLSEQDFRKVAQAMSNQQSLPIQIYGSKVKDIPSILSETKRLRNHWVPNGSFKGLGLLVIDYIQMIRGHGKDRFDVLSQVAEDAKDLAKMLDLPVVALAQIARDMSKRDSKIPHLGDIRGSGDIENAADIVAFTHRPEYYIEREEPPKDYEQRADWQADYDRAKGKMEIIVGKKRMGRIGKVTVACDVGTNRFEDIHTQDEMVF